MTRTAIDARQERATSREAIKRVADQLGCIREALRGLGP
jgi:hypothetical protein